MINVAQRILYNHLEQMPVLIIETVIAGLMYPTATIVAIWVFLLGRVMYAFGFKSSPKLRGPGFGLGMLSIFTLHVCTVMSVYGLVKANN